MRRERGITLIALIITIIILIILAAITITTLSNFDIINIAGHAAENYKSAEEEEIEMFSELSNKYGSDVGTGSIGGWINEAYIASLENEIEGLKSQIETLNDDINNKSKITNYYIEYIQSDTTSRNLDIPITENSIGGLYLTSGGTCYATATIPASNFLSHLARKHTII